VKLRSIEKENKAQTAAIKVGEENTEQAIESVTPNCKKAMIKTSIYGAFITFAISVAKLTPAKGYLTAEALGSSCPLESFSP
jgi:hypothetical protein